MRTIYTLVFCLICFTALSQQNLKVDFKPLKSVGILPPLFTKPLKETLTEGITDINQLKDSTTKLKSDLFIVTNYEIDWEIKSGNSLINEEITEYLNDIASIILKDDPETRQKVKIYTSKSPAVNAATFYNGTVFVDLGLLARAENEAQMAYALCHEITHFKKQHTIQSLVHQDELIATSEGRTSEDVFKEWCQYSRDHEKEADSVGFILFQNSNYDLTQALEVFDILLYSELPFDLIEFNKSFFETENFKIPEKYVIKELAPVKDRSGKDDTKMSHPEPSKRKECIKNMLPPGLKGVKFNLGEERFNYIRDLARFEICRLFLRYRDYNAALYSAYILSTKYPDNLFLTRIISKCLYAISLNHTGYLRYTYDSYLDGPIHYLQVESYQQQLYYLINKLTDSEWNIMSLNYVYRKHKKFPGDPVLRALSDSLLKTMYYVNANFETGAENKFFKNINTNTDTTSWYNKVFTDLFSSDIEFSENFPDTIGHDFVMPYTPKSYHKNRFEKKMRIVENIGKVMCLKPSYTLYDDSELQTLYLKAEEDQENLLASINKCAAKQKFELVLLDPGSIDSTDVGKINDYSVVTDWLNECSDAYQNEKFRVPIFNTDELSDVVERYGTSHLLRIGFAVINGKSKYYVFFSIVYDLRQNRQVFIKQQVFNGKPTKADMEEKISTLFTELKFGEKK